MKSKTRRSWIRVVSDPCNSDANAQEYVLGLELWFERSTSQIEDLDDSKRTDDEVPFVFEKLLSMAAVCLVCALFVACDLQALMNRHVMKM